MQRKGHLGLAIVLLLTLAAPVQAATPKAGSKCNKAGTTATASGKKFTCIKSGTKLVWNKGVAVAKPSPVATPTPTPPCDTYPSEISCPPKPCAHLVQVVDVIVVDVHQPHLLMYFHQ